jgi:hypothetical protein
MQAKAGLGRILSRYEVAPCKDTPLNLEFDTRAFILKTCGEMPLSFRRISH